MSSRLQTTLRKPEGRYVSCRLMETFLVRVWTPYHERPLEGIRGTAVHLGSGRSVTYTRTGGLLRFLAETASDEARMNLVSPLARSDPPE